MGGTVPEPKDPFLQSLRTSRDQKKAKMELMLKPMYSTNSNIHINKNNSSERVFEPVTSKYRRGYAHSDEYGTFSSFTGVLQRNASSSMFR
jgi:hypothetical protein